ncbi:sorcin-like isoform X2 [Entelurus aequoreus]|uniref:sorcin-like isoform X2 n=1 Tax=Entelurus aequoreus TaxID=161455 RepID=UPI002B1DBBB6|nr:sorcin-like isoform X2 [Entelurus aequoreus]
MAYAGYGAPNPHGGGFPGMQPQQQQQDPLYGYFAAVAGQDGQISPEELQQCLTQSGISGGYKPFNLDTCRLMINMLDRDMSGSMGFTEFRDLWQALNGWKSSFVSYDRDRSGTVEGNEMQQAITSMGYNMSPHAMNAIMRRYSTNGRIPFDDFVCCFVRLRALTDHFRRRDTSHNGSASFQYDDFIQVTMSM